MKILPGQVFTLHDKPFSGVSRTFQAKEQFDLSQILMNGTYQYDFAHKYYGEEEASILMEEKILLDWFSENYKELVNETIADSKTTNIRFIIARDIQMADDNHADDYVAIEENNRFVINFPEAISFYKAIPTESFSDLKYKLDSLCEDSLLYTDKKSALDAWKKDNSEYPNTQLSIIEVKLDKVVLNYDDKYQHAKTYFRTLDPIDKKDFIIHNIEKNKIISNDL